MLELKQTIKPKRKKKKTKRGVDRLCCMSQVSKFFVSNFSTQLSDGQQYETSSPVDFDVKYLIQFFNKKNCQVKQVIFRLTF